MAKSQITEAGIAEPLVCGIRRAGVEGQLPMSPIKGVFHLWYDMIEDGSAQVAKKQPLGVSEDLDLALIVRNLTVFGTRNCLRMLRILDGADSLITDQMSSSAKQARSWPVEVVYR